MTFFECFRKWNNQFVDVDGAFGPQCMDWMHKYLEEVFGFPRSVLNSPSAKQCWYNFTNLKGSQYFIKIPNRLWNKPQQGDVIFWNFGTDGHVAIVNEATVWRLTSLDQNYPKNSPVHVQEHNYNGCLGWLRKK